ncbi:hypothetical protein ACHAXT_002960 [Thalassiosira profunda]
MATVPRNGSGLLRKRSSFHQSKSSGGLHNLQQDRSYQPNAQQLPPTPSKPSGDEESSKRPQKLPLHTLMPQLSIIDTDLDGASHYKRHTPTSNGHDSNGHCSLPPGQRPRTANGNGFPGNVCQRETLQLYTSKFRRRLDALMAKVRNWNDEALQQSPRYQRTFNNTTPHLRIFFNLLRAIFLELASIRCTCRQKLSCLFILAISYSNYIYFVKMPLWSYEEEWTQWEEGMERSVAALIPPLPSGDLDISHNNYWRTNPRQLDQFFSLMRPSRNQYTAAAPPKKSSVADPAVPDASALDVNEAAFGHAFAVPIPDYELMGEIRGELAQVLRRHAAKSCQSDKRDPNNPVNRHALPVIGITVATDTPNNRYLRRLLHTIDFTTVGSIVITWYDEQTEAQLVGKGRDAMSHEVIVEALSEFITRKGFARVSWENATNVEGRSALDTNLDGSFEEKGNDAQRPQFTQMADATSLKLLSRIATSIDQFCLFDTGENERICRNELLVLRFPTNLGCSSGVNNPLFTHPTAPHWLIANYDIAYPPGVLDAMAKELLEARMRNPDLAVHTYGYIYGRGKLENPWSNFVMTSCAVANVGVWDEDIFPAYYEDDDFRDRIRYLLGTWTDVIGDPDNHGDVPQYFMNDSHLIRYQTDRHVAVAHGPLTATTYLSGTHETMQQVIDEENRPFWMKLFAPAKPPNPFQYDSHRWNLVEEVSDTERFFRCKHGALPDAGEHGEDAIRYFGWNERFLQPFVNRTREARRNESVLYPEHHSSRADSNTGSLWSRWTFNATRRKCVHEAANLLLQLPPSEERTNLTLEYRALCSVC